MTIRISNLNGSNIALAGTVIGELTVRNASGNVINCTFSLTKGSVGVLAISGNDLVTAWAAPTIAGNYSVRVRALRTASRFRDSAIFIIEVGSAVAPPPPALPPPPLSRSALLNCLHCIEVDQRERAALLLFVTGVGFCAYGMVSTSLDVQIEVVHANGPPGPAKQAV